MQQPAQMPGGPSPFAMDNMRQELSRMSQHNGSGAWATEFDPGMQQHMQPTSPGFNPAEFARFQSTNAATEVDRLQLLNDTDVRNYLRSESPF